MYNRAVACAWTVVLGATALLLGAGLALTAPRRGRELRQWEKERAQRLGEPEPDGRERPAFMRSFGVAFAALGAGLLWAGAAGSWCPSPINERSRLAGAALLLIGLRRPWRAFRESWSSPAFLRNDPLGSIRRDPAERAAEGCAWCLSVLWTSFGAWNLGTR